MSDEFRARLSSGLTLTLERLTSLPGVVGTVDVLPDIRSRVDHGFVSGVSFRSLRLHPTAIGDMGDGIAIAEIEGVYVDELLARTRIWPTSYWRFYTVTGTLASISYPKSGMVLRP